MLGGGNLFMVDDAYQRTYHEAKSLVISTEVFWYLQGSERAAANAKKRSGELRSTREFL